MSQTSESVPPSLGAMFLNLFVFESKTARFETLAATVPLCCLTWVNLPPSQMLVPTCSIARTVPLTIGVLSAFSEGNASTAPPAKRATTVDNSEKTVLLITNSFFSWGKERMETPTLSPWLINTAPEEETLQEVGTPQEAQTPQQSGTPQEEETLQQSGTIGEKKMPQEAGTPQEEETLQQSGTIGEKKTPQEAGTTAEAARTQQVSRKVSLEVGLEVMLEMSRKQPI